MDFGRRHATGIGICCLFFIWHLVSVTAAVATETNGISDLTNYNVSWNGVGPTSSQSMPLGNGDIGLNVWIEANGDVSFYISKSDAWSADAFGNFPLLKLGQVRVSINPNPF